jgi:hypothetical protein
MATPTVFDAASFARWLTANQTYGSMATATEYSVPFASEEDFADSASIPGLPIFILPTAAVAHKHLVRNNSGSLSIAREECDCKYNCANLPFDVLVCERFTMLGDFEPLGVVKGWPTTNADVNAYAKRHPAFAAYLQFGTPHSWFMWRLVPTQIFYTGGYGGLHYIGDIPIAVYMNATARMPP